MSFLRSLLMALMFPLFTAILSIVCVILSYTFRSRKIDDQVVVFWGRATCWMFGVRVQVKGLENLPRGKGAVLLFNHTSFFDIFSMVGYIPSLRFGAKIELFKIPFFGPAMRQVGNLPIDRARRENVFKIYDKAQERIQGGERFALAPEGSRMEIESLAPFKAGPFIFAINAQAPIVPVIVRGASRILPKGHAIPNREAWTNSIELIILPPIETKGMNVEQRPELQNQVFNLMKPYLSQESLSDDSPKLT